MRVRSSFVSILFCKRVHFDMRDSISRFLSFFLYGLFAYPFPIRLKLNKGWLLVISSCRLSDKVIALSEIAEMACLSTTSRAYLYCHIQILHHVFRGHLWCVCHGEQNHELEGWTLERDQTETTRQSTLNSAGKDSPSFTSRQDET